MARPIWKGSISFGLVTIPVGLYSAVERSSELSFRLLHGKDGSRIDYKRFCTEEHVEVPWGEIVKGYEYEKGRFVVITDEDFEKARVPATQTITITDFVPATDIDSIYFDHPYYVAPAGKPGTKAYALLRDALQETGRIGVGTVVLRQREHLVAVEPAGKLLAVTTMRWGYEIREADGFDVPAAGDGWAEKEMKLARQLIDTLAADWNPDKYEDTYRDAIMDVIQQKIEGKDIETPRLPKAKPVVDLVKALERSLAEPRKAPARAKGRREKSAHAARTRRGKGKRAA
jgi:DNA end-binding protein Ku